MGLKIPSQQWRVGSSPTTGTIFVVRNYCKQNKAQDIDNIVCFFAIYGIFELYSFKFYRFQFLY